MCLVAKDSWPGQTHNQVISRREPEEADGIWVSEATLTGEVLMRQVTHLESPHRFSVPAELHLAPPDRVPFRADRGGSMSNEKKQLGREAGEPGTGQHPMIGGAIGNLSPEQVVAALDWYHSLSEEANYALLISLFHPQGLVCPRCGGKEGMRIHRRHREPVLDFQCPHCGRVFNAWTGTPLQKTHHRPRSLVRLIRAILLRQPTSELARELGCQRVQLQALRIRVQRVVWRSSFLERMVEALGCAQVVSRA
jgi:transposase-like protein